MINPAELRIGSLVLDNHGAERVVCGFRYGYIILDCPNPPQQETVNPEKANGIQLNQYQLEKFCWYSMRNGNYVFDDNNYYSISPDGSLYFNDVYTAVDIEFVHQLQNLYCSLTKNEIPKRN